ncbi:hypothetical protein Patl1_16696 [Pistacia atlantica]|uniref:Uncharacterized protein n=1 Tax=Pistacia atlantica TaxID=434234 RepID=A0ACC1B8M7_9ROSI|nr:hypothetical protein Patl1_16696 [Pistacia atlantica]
MLGSFYFEIQTKIQSHRMSRGCWNCGQNGHSSQTCPNSDFKLSGIRVGLFRRSLSTGHLRRSLRLSPEKSDYGDGYLSEDLECGRLAADREKNSNTGEEDAESSSGSTTGTEYYSCIAELDNNNNGVNEAHQRTNDYYKRVTLKWIFVISNFVCEILTALFEQLSSPHQSHYALIGMTMSLAATIICVIEIVYKCRQQKVTWRIRGKIYWFYHPPPSHKCFGTFKDILGFACATLQSISGVISYTFYLKHGNSPIKISLCSVVFALGLLCSKFCDEQEKVDID